MSLEITPPLKAALRKLYHKEGCDQNGWAYVSLENIHSSKKTIFWLSSRGLAGSTSS